MSVTDHLADTHDLRDKITRLEQWLTDIESDLNETLGIRDDEHAAREEEAGDNYLSRFADMLAYLQEQERHTVKAPLERWKAIQMKDVVDLESMNVAQLMGLYQTYLAGQDTRGDYEIDDEFEGLIEHRRLDLESYFWNNSKRWCPIQEFLDGLTDRKNAIATFLILLDMVFRNILIMKDDRNTVQFRKNESSEQDVLPD